MKAVSVPIDWLNEIDGMTVADALAYLGKFPGDHTLSYWQSGGDDQGVEITSDFAYQRPYTEKELADLAAQRKAKRIKEREASIAYYEKQVAWYESQGNATRAAQYQQDVERAKQRLKEAL